MRVHRDGCDVLISVSRVVAYYTAGPRARLVSMSGDAKTFLPNSETVVKTCLGPDGVRGAALQSLPKHCQSALPRWSDA